MAKYSHKVTYHTVEDSQKVENAQLFQGENDAKEWADIQQCRCFTPVTISQDTNVDGMEHIGDIAPQVHQGHYIRR